MKGRLMFRKHRPTWVFEGIPLSKQYPNRYQGWHLHLPVWLKCMACIEWEKDSVLRQIYVLFYSCCLWWTVAICQLELPTCTLCGTWMEKLRFLSWSCQNVFGRMLRLYWRCAIFKPIVFAHCELNSCRCLAGAAAHVLCTSWLPLWRCFSLGIIIVQQRISSANFEYREGVFWTPTAIFWNVGNNHWIRCPFMHIYMHKLNKHNTGMIFACVQNYDTTWYDRIWYEYFVCMNVCM